MQIQLPVELERYVRDKVASGEYASPEEVLIESLHVLRNVERALPQAQDDLRREIDLGLRDIEAGRVCDWNVEELKELIRKRGRKAS